MKLFKKVVVMFGFALFVAAPGLTLIAPTNSFAISTDSSCERPLLGVIKPWFRGLAGRDDDGKCQIASPGQDLNGTPLELEGFVWRIALNVIDIALTIVGIIAFLFILYGGFQYLTGGDKPDKVEGARKTIFNAVIGLVISISAVAIINFTFGILG